METKELHAENLIIGKFILRVKIVKEKSDRQTRHKAYCKIVDIIKKPNKALQKSIDEGTEL